MISRQAYENGIVICTCQKCGVRHLLADNLKKVRNNISHITGRYVKSVLKR